MSIHNLDIRNAINAYSKQISLSRFVQKKKAATALKSLVEEAIHEETEQPSDDADQEVEETDEN